MSSQFRIDEVNTALLALLNGVGLSLEYGQPVQVDTLGDRDFDQAGRLVLEPPALRVRFLSATYSNAKDNQRLTYQAKYPFEILCFQSSLRSPDDERNQTLALVACVVDQLAGARLALSDGSLSMPITIDGVELVVTDQGPVDQFYAVRITIEGIAQFSGANAQG